MSQLKYSIIKVVISMERKRMIQLIKILSKQQFSIQGSKLCEELNISVRTLRNDIKNMKVELFSNGIEIISKHAVGYSLKINDETKYYQYIENMMKEESESQMLIPIYPEDRINYLIRMFLTENDYIKIEDICERIFVSRSTLSNDLKEVRNKLHYFHLDLETKPSYGMKIKGTEFHKRSCISQYFFHTEGHDDIFLSKLPASNEQKIISSLLYQTMLEEKFKLTDIGFQNLVIHIMIALIRLEESIQQTFFSYDDAVKESHEYEIAKRICRKLEDTFSINFPEIETYFITLHLLGKKAVQYETNSLMFAEEYDNLLDNILDDIKDKYNLDLSGDISLHTSLILHLLPMMNRLKYKMVIQNPLIEQIKQENGLAFDISVMVAQTIEEKYNLEVSENEMGYIALHFALAIERYKKILPKKNIIIICASGMGSSQILLYKIRQKFKDSIESIYVTELYELENIDQSLYDFILTTVPIPFKTVIPSYYVQYFLTNKDIVLLSDAFKDNNNSMNFIDEYFCEELLFNDLQGKTKEELIHEMCERIKQVKDIDNNFEKEVLRREKLSVTEFGNYIAMPHPLKPITDETFVTVGILKKTVKWKEKYVKYIFLLSVKKDSTETLSLLHETLSALVYDKKAMIEIEKNPTLVHMKQILKEIAKEQKENDIDILFD